MVVTGRDIQQALRALGLSGQVVCLQSSLRSFGHVAGGATAVLRAFLDEGCTILVPTFSSFFEVAPPPHLQFERNGWNYTSAPNHSLEKVFTPEVPDIDRYMGVIPATALSWTTHIRGNHPLDSFTAVGPQAAKVIGGQAPLNVYAPLAALAQMKGFVLLMGVGLERMTLLHLAEKEAGRTLFRRWANDAHGQTMVVEVGGCSEGFGKLEPCLRPVMRKINVGQSKWTLLPAAEALAYAAEAIRADPQITHCGVETCERCNDAVKGGPSLAMTSEREKIQSERKALRREYGELYDRVSRLLFTWDPIGINFEHNTDEYEPEVGTILPRLRSCASAEDVQRVVHEEFCRWFDADEAGPLESYEQIGRDIWTEIRGFHRV